MENITQWCYNAGLLPYSALPALNDKSKIVWVWVGMSGSKDTPAADVTAPRPPLDILNSGESLALMITIHNQNV